MVFPINKFISCCNILVVLIAVAIGIRVSLFSQTCQKDSLVDIALPTSSGSSNSHSFSVDPCQVFSSSYEEARSAFRNAVTSLGLSTTPLNIAPMENDDEDYYTTDIAVIPGDSSGLVIHSSGVHGVEGYAGSAIQLAFLDYLYKYQEKQADSETSAFTPLPGMPTIILVHAVNPHGMAHFRRPNENNVDLNRNAMTKEELELLITTHVNHATYQKFDKDFFNYPHQPTFWDAYVGIWWRSVANIAIHGFPALKAAMVGGQYYQPKGIFYGGNTLQPSIWKLARWFQEYFASTSTTTTETDSENEESSTEDTNDTASSFDGPITWIDVHTGLGPMGVDTLFGFVGEHDDIDAMTAETSNWFPGAKFSASSSTKDDGQEENKVTQGYEQTKGFVVDYFQQHILPKSKRDDIPLLMLGQEFGTVPGTLVGHALMIENAAHWTEALSPQEKMLWAKRTTARAFYPQSPAWRRSVLERGMILFFQALARSSKASE